MLAHHAEQKVTKENCSAKTESTSALQKRPIALENPQDRQKRMCTGHRSTQSCRHSLRPGRNVSERDLRAKTRKSIPTAGFYHSLRAVRRRACESGDRIAVQKISQSRSVRLCYAKRTGAGNSTDGIFQE